LLSFAVDAVRMLLLLLFKNNEYFKHAFSWVDDSLLLKKLTNPAKLEMIINAS
jgi:hypothetical protein